MFEKIVLRRSDEGPSLSAGELAEALLFYQNVHLILDYGSLIDLIKQIGTRSITALLARPSVSAVYCENMLGTHTETRNGIATHNFIAFGFAGDQESGLLRSRKKMLEYVLTKKCGCNEREAKRFVDSFRMKVPFRDLTNDHFIEGGMVLAARNDLHDGQFVCQCIKTILGNLMGSEDATDDFSFEVNVGPAGFQIHTTLDFPFINKELQKRGLFDGEITPAYLLTSVLNARADTVLASFYGGEFYTSALASEIIRIRCSNLLRRIEIERNEVREFHEIVVGTAPSLREAINSKVRTFDEFLVLLDKSRRFKEWIKGVNPDEKLVREYWKQVTSEGWINSLPIKGLRYFIGSALGAVEPISGHVASLADSFLIEKIIGGWRPNHFVERSLKPFIGPDNV